MLKGRTACELNVFVFATNKAERARFCYLTRRQSMKTSSEHKENNQEQLELQGNIWEDFICFYIHLCPLPFFRVSF